MIFVISSKWSGKYGVKNKERNNEFEVLIIILVIKWEIVW